MDELKVVIELTIPENLCFACAGHSLARILDFYNTGLETRNMIRRELKKISKSAAYEKNCIICNRKVNCLHPDQ